MITSFRGANKFLSNFFIEPDGTLEAGDIAQLPETTGRA